LLIATLTQNFNSAKLFSKSKFFTTSLHFIALVLENYLLFHVGGDIDYITVESFDLDTNSWQTLSDLPSEANQAPALVQSAENIYLVNPEYNNVMLFNEEDLTFEIINGQGTGVTGPHAAIIPVNDENLHGC
jgi:hypothetical protein